jgi:hypothetical protein
MQNCAPPPQRAPERLNPSQHARGHENALFASFNPVPNTYAYTVLKAGGFEFLALLLKENRLFELRDNRLPTSVPARATTCLFVNTSKLVLSLCPLFPEGSNERETLPQFVHFLPQLLHAQGLRPQDIESSSQLIAQGKWRHVWQLALAQAARLRAKCEQNPETARQRSLDEKAKYDLKCANAGNLTKACKIVCQGMTPACSDDTVHKLRDLHPERSMDLNLENLPTPESLTAFWDSEDGMALKNKWFSVKNAQKYFHTCQALGAADIDGWRGREHALYLFMNNDTELHQLILDELIFPYIMGEFLPQFLPELAGGASCLRFSRKMVAATDAPSVRMPLTRQHIDALQGRDGDGGSAYGRRRSVRRSINARGETRIFQRRSSR